MIIIRKKSKKENTVNSNFIEENKNKYFPVYFLITDSKTNKEDLSSYNIFHLDSEKCWFKNEKNEEEVIYLNDIKKIDLNLKARTTVMGPFGTEFVFDIILDLESNNKKYYLKAKNKDDMLEIILFFKKNNISIIDSRNIEKAYEMYPTYLDRTKYFRRKHKDLMKKCK